MITLYDFLPSGNGYKVRLTLRELGVPFRYREMDILRAETREPWFLALNAAGQIPVLQLEDGTCISESTAILFHLAQGSALLPDDALARTRVLQWMCFEQTNVDGVISRAIFRTLYPNVIPTRREEFKVWWREGERTLQVLDQHLDGHSFFVNDSFSIADITLYAYVHRAELGGFNLKPYQALQRWFRRVEARPAHIPISVVPA